MKKQIIGLIIVILVIIIVVMGVLLWGSKQGSVKNDENNLTENVNYDKDNVAENNINNSIQESNNNLNNNTNNTSPATTNKNQSENQIDDNQIDLEINNSLYYINRSEKGKILAYPQGKRINLSFYIKNTKLKLDKIRIEIKGANQSVLQVLQEDKNRYGKVGYMANYIPKNDGVDTIIIYIGNNKRKKYKIVIYNTDFLVPNYLSLNQVHFDFSNILKINKKEKVQKSMGGMAWFEPAMPGYIKYDFLSKYKNGKATLIVYALSPAIETFRLSNYFHKMSSVPAYVDNFYKLQRIINSKGENLDNIHIANFPPANASCISPKRLKYLETDKFKGIRYMIYGCYQEVDFPNDVQYIFQGFTNDKKYHIYFEYSEVISDKLENFKKDFNNKAFNEKDYEKAIQKAMEILVNEKENSFKPSLLELDKIVKTIQVK